MTLENNALIVEINNHGAEITRIFDKETGCERLWNADPRYWKRSSPVLFPTVGKLFNRTMHTETGDYTFSQHGFARDMDFECISAECDTAVYELRTSEETFEKYPRRFVLRISYTLKDKEIIVCWHVENEGEEEMPFTIGGHPAFCFEADLPKKSDHYILIPGISELKYCLLNPEHGCAEAEELSLSTDQGYIHLTEEMFANDALIFDHSQITEAWLCDHERKPIVGLKAPNFPNFGIWSVKEAPFVCLEPWQGRCDNMNYDDLFRNKPGAVCLEMGESFNISYSIVIA